MAKQTINIGVAANDGSGDPFRIAFDKCNDNFTEVYDDIESIEASIITAESILRSKLTETCDGTSSQIISFSSQFVSVYALQIIDYEGIGITVLTQDEDGFTIESLSAGNFGYIALVEI